MISTLGLEDVSFKNTTLSFRFRFSFCQFDFFFQSINFKFISEVLEVEYDIQIDPRI